MKEPRLITDIMLETLEEVDRLGWDKAFGLSPRPNHIPDPRKCRCGGGCDSLLECTFWYWLRKTEAVERGCRRQVIIGQYRVDVFCEWGGKRIVVELDGKEFHQDQHADIRRDKVLLEAVDAVIRIPGPALHWYPEAVFSILGRWYSRFELRGCDIFCMPAAEFRNEIEGAVHGDGDYLTVESFLDWADPNYELWSDHDTFGRVGSPKMFYRDNVPGSLFIHRRRRIDSA